jgi:hypothetical protein
MEIPLGEDLVNGRVDRETKLREAGAVDNKE